MQNDFIVDIVTKKDITDRDELVVLLWDKVETPSESELRRRYIATKVNHIIATIRDKDGQRGVLAKRGTDGTKYVNLQKCNDLKILDEIKKRLEREIKGRTQSLKKVQKKIAKGQMDMFKVIDNADKIARR